MAGMAPKQADLLVDDGDEEANVTPEEQAAYEALIDSAMELIYSGGEVNPGIVKMLDDDPSDLMAVLGDTEAMAQFSPLVAISATAVMVVLEVVRRGGDVDDTVIFHAGRAIVEDLVEVAEKVQQADYTPDEVNKCFLMAADLYREVAAQQGLVDENELKAQFEEFVKADKEGRLGELSPELEEVNRRAQMNVEEGEEPEQWV